MEQSTGEGVTRLTEEVGATLRRVLAESPQVAQCLDRVRAEGFDVSVVLEATIGFTRAEGRAAATAPTLDFRVEKASASATPAAGPVEPLPLNMTPLDRKFLRSLKITVEDEEK
jgi:hypothetical protein